MKKIETQGDRETMLEASKMELQEIQLLRILKSLIDKTISVTDDGEIDYSFTKMKDIQNFEHLIENFVDKRPGFNFRYLHQLLKPFHWSDDDLTFSDDFMKSDASKDIQMFLEDGWIFKHYEVLERLKPGSKAVEDVVIGVSTELYQLYELKGLNTESHKIYKIYVKRDGYGHGDKTKAVCVYPTRK